MRLTSDHSPSPETRRNPPLSVWIAAGLFAVAALGGCGGDDEPVFSASTTGAATTAGTSSPGPDGGLTGTGGTASNGATTGVTPGGTNATTGTTGTNATSGTGGTTATSGGTTNGPPTTTTGATDTDGGVPTGDSGVGTTGDSGAGTTGAGDPSQWNDPGTEPFVPVPEADVAAECGLDIDMLRASGYRNGAVFRYGKLCYSDGTIDRPYGVFSVTKTVAGTVMAAAYWETRENERRILPSDPVSEWGGSGSTRISEYAGMVAGSGSGREWGSHSFAYDTLGSNLARTGPPMEESLSQGSVSGATSLSAVRDNLFAKLGVGGSWPTTTWGTGANISLTDMARIGIALIHGGWYNGEQVLDPDWVYWMTHPHWEDATTSYGMYAWLNHRGNGAGIGGTLSSSGAGPAGGNPCAPAAVWQRYPHPPSEATDCNPQDGLSCEQTYDTGVFSAQGLGGQFLVGHRGLDLVMVAQNYSGEGGPVGLWEMVRPSLVALDPMFMGDEEAFCEAYGNGDYAPDLIVEPVQPDEQ